MKFLVLSDIHLAGHCQNHDRLTNLIDQHRDYSLILAGDILDQLRSPLLKFSDKDLPVLKAIKDHPDVVYLPGNHDIPMRQMTPWFSEVYEFKDGGRKIGIIHGDQFEQTPYWVQLLMTQFQRYFDKCFGTDIQNTLRRLNIKGDDLVIDGSVEEWIPHLTKIQQRIIQFGHDRQYDVIISGHNHLAAHFRDGGLEYLNTGTWVNKGWSSYVTVIEGTPELHIIK